MASEREPTATRQQQQQQQPEQPDMLPKSSLTLGSLSPTQLSPHTFSTLLPTQESNQLPMFTVRDNNKFY